MAQRRGGTISFAVAGVRKDAKGTFTYNLGRPKRETIVGADGVHGYKEIPQPAFIEGALTDDGTLDVAALTEFNGGTVTLEVANGKVIALRDAWFAGEGTVSTEEGEIAVRYEGKSAEEVS